MKIAQCSARAHDRQFLLAANSEALPNIAQTTLENVSLFERSGQCQNEVSSELLH